MTHRHCQKADTMKESVLDVLIYLFENYADPDFQHEIETGHERGNARGALRDELTLAGFRAGAVDSALSWLDALAADSERQPVPPTPRALRVFSAAECDQLTAECR